MSGSVFPLGRTVQVTCVSVCQQAAPAAGLTLTGVVLGQVFVQLPVVGPPGGDGGVLSPQPVTGQLVLYVLPPEAGRGGDRRTVQLWQIITELRLQITAEDPLQLLPALLVGAM